MDGWDEQKCECECLYIKNSNKKSFYARFRNFHPRLPLQVTCSVCVHGISPTFRQVLSTRLDFRGLYLLPLFKFLGTLSKIKRTPAFSSQELSTTHMPTSTFVLGRFWLDYCNNFRRGVILIGLFVSWPFHFRAPGKKTGWERMRQNESLVIRLYFALLKTSGQKPSENVSSYIVKNWLLHKIWQRETSDEN